MAAAELTRPVNRDAQFSYVLDCAVELGEVTPMEASVFMVDNHAALALSDSMDGNGEWNPHSHFAFDSLPVMRFHWPNHCSTQCLSTGSFSLSALLSVSLSMVQNDERTPSCS